MKNEVTVLGRLQQWYLSQCNQDWEHSFGVKVDTLDNPGWHVTIDLRETEWEGLVIPRVRNERSQHDWVQTEVSNQTFIGCGGPCNLEEIIQAFLDTVRIEVPDSSTTRKHTADGQEVSLVS